MNSYASHEYALTCAHLGTPRLLPRSGVTVLVRSLAGSGHELDACATYPLLATQRWRELAADLDEQHDLLSFVGVVDPLAQAAKTTLAALFPDRLLAFKAHHVALLDPAHPLAHAAGPHRRKAQRAAKKVAVEVAANPSAHAADWLRLYSGLRVRHGLAGAADFPGESLAAQLGLAGMLAVLARQDERVVSMSLWLVSGEVAHYHLGASDVAGYEAGASYATFARAFEALAECGVRCVDLGGSAGEHDRADGLARFKQGWASETRTAWLGGRVLDRTRYEALCGSRGSGEYFPAYRAGVAA